MEGELCPMKEYKGPILQIGPDVVQANVTLRKKIVLLGGNNLTAHQLKDRGCDDDAFEKYLRIFPV